MQTPLRVRTLPDNMKFSSEFPPNIDKIRKVLTPPDTASFCYGDTIHGPHIKDLDSSQLLHEAVHTKQQGDRPEEWWDRYLAEPAFRLSQELEAYQVQYRYVSQTISNRDQVALRLYHMARDLSSEMYKAGITQNEARTAIIKDS